MSESCFYQMGVREYSRFFYCEQKNSWLMASSYSKQEVYMVINQRIEK